MTNYFSMFSGIGGFELGIQNAFSKSEELQSETLRSKQDGNSTKPTIREQHVTCIGYSEIDKYAIKVYERNFSGHRNFGDATTINPTNLPDFDLLVGGFPCQAFSIAGKRAGFNDTRGTLFFDIARILSEKRPRHLVLENVKGLLSHDSGQTFQTILRILTDLGYRAEWQVLNSKDFGVPQNRERIYIVGHSPACSGGKVFPITGQSNQYTTLGKSTKTAVARTLTGGGHSGGNHSGMTIINGIRRLTPLECERLQGFPDDWTKYGINDEPISDTQRYKMCGNAVTVNVVQAVMERLYDA